MKDIALYFFFYFLYATTFNHITMHTSYKSIAISLMCMLFSHAAIAQFYSYSPMVHHNFSHWEIDPYKNRFNEIGIVAGIGSPTCKAYYYIADNKGRVREKSVTARAKTSLNYGLNVGTGIHIARLNENKSLALNLGVIMLFSKVSISNNELKIKNGTVFNEELELLRSGIPISLDYKVGAEAASDKYLKSMFTMGAGISPRFVSEGFLGGYAIPSLSPFVKVEAGYYLGVAFKIRAMYFFGEQLWNDSFFLNAITNDELPAYGATYRLSTQGEFLLSLIVMPYSGSWE